MNWRQIEMNELLNQSDREQARVLAAAFSETEVLEAVKHLWRRYPTLATQLTLSLATAQGSLSREHATAELSRLLYWTGILANALTVQAKPNLTMPSRPSAYRMERLLRQAESDLESQA